MKDRSFILRLAPDKLWQSINPGWFQGANFSWLRFDLGATSHPETEQKILDEVGTYGRQIGRMGDVLEILVQRLDRKKLSPEEKDAITIFEGQLAQVRAIKRRMQ